MTQKMIKIIENISKEVLFEGSFEDGDLIAAKAAEYEEMGLDVEIIAPSVSETLIMNLGASKEDIQTLRQTSLDEIESHNSPSCTVCVDDTTKKNTH